MNLRPLAGRLKGIAACAVWLVPLLLAVAESNLVAAAKLPLPVRFQFGPGSIATGWVQVLPETRFSQERGYGFEPGAEIQGFDRGGTDPRHAHLCTSSQPFLFSVVLPEGNYHVTVSIGDPAAGSTNTIKAETRRLMLERVGTAAGQFASRQFTVNIRTPAIPGGGAVRLKAREQGALHWDNKLTLEFNGARPAVGAVVIEPATNTPTVFLLGDSTVTDQPAEPWNSWGQMLTRFFKPGVAVANHAESGESLKSSLGARRVAKVLASLRAGDYVLIQFGHNDQKDRAPNAVQVYEANLKQLVADIRRAKATPVLVTSMERMSGVEKDTLGEYPAAMAQVARAEGVALIDLHAMSRVFYRALGPEIKRAFQDGTHHNAYGSYELARCVIEGIRQDHLDLARFIADDAGVFDPAHPDPVDQFHIPPSPGLTTIKPEGN